MSSYTYDKQGFKIYQKFKARVLSKLEKFVNKIWRWKSQKDWDQAMLVKFW